MLSPLSIPTTTPPNPNILLHCLISMHTLYLFTPTLFLIFCLTACFYSSIAPIYSHTIPTDCHPVRFYSNLAPIYSHQHTIQHLYMSTMSLYIPTFPLSIHTTKPSSPYILPPCPLPTPILTPITSTLSSIYSNYNTI